MANKSARAKGAIIDASDLRYFFRIFSNNWYFVVIAVLLSLLLSYLYSYKLPAIYGAQTQVLLDNHDIYDYQNQVYKNIGYVDAYGDIVNQKRVLNSHDLIGATLDKLDFGISYFNIGRFKTTEMYEEPHVSLPFKVQVARMNGDLFEKPFDLKVIDVGSFELRYDKGAGVVAHKYDFNVDIVENDFSLRVIPSDQISLSNVQELANADYQFTVHSRNWLINKYKQRLTVENFDYTSILQISVTDELAARAKLFLDTLSKVYIDYTLQSEFDINRNTLQYINKQLDEVSVILNEFEDELQVYKEGKEILDLNREENRYFNELVKFDNQRRRGELQIESLNSLEAYLTSNVDEKLLPPSVYILEDDGFLKVTLSQLYEMQMNRTELLYSAKPENEAIQKVDDTIDLIKKNLLVYINNTRKALRDQIGDFQGQISDYESLIRKVPKSQRDILNIERKVQVNERLYLFLLEKRANTVIARAGILPTTKVIESARNLGVVKPDKVKIAYTFGIGGLLLSLIFIFIRVMFYERIENGDQLREHTNLPLYGEVVASAKAEDNYVVVDSDPKSAITESFRTIRTNLEYIPSQADGKGKVVLISSYRPNEGKTFCSVNLAAILAKAGKKVLLLELDLHKPKVAKGLNMVADVGLSSILAGKGTVESGIMSTHIENFDVMLAGPTPPNASELVLSKYLTEIFEKGVQMYDYVMVDTPPIGLITDALVMMKQADATMFVMNTRFANKDHIRNALEAYENNNIKNFGFILNGVRIKKSKYYYNTNYGYGYRYAYGYGSGYGNGYGYGYGYGRRRKNKDANDDDQHES